MAVKRREVEWEHTSYLLAKLHNVNRSLHSSAVTPAQLNPYPPRRQRGTRAQVNGSFHRGMYAMLKRQGKLSRRRKGKRSDGRGIQRQF